MTLSDSWDSPPSNPNNRRSSVVYFDIRCQNRRLPDTAYVRAVLSIRLGLSLSASNANFVLPLHSRCDIRLFWHLISKYTTLERRLLGLLGGESQESDKVIYKLNGKQTGPYLVSCVSIIFINFFFNQKTMKTVKP